MRFLFDIIRRKPGTERPAERRRSETRRMPSSPIAPSTFGFLEIAAERFDR